MFLRVSFKWREKIVQQLAAGPITCRSWNVVHLALNCFTAFLFFWIKERSDCKSPRSWNWCQSFFLYSISGVYIFLRSSSFFESKSSLFKNCGKQCDARLLWRTAKRWRCAASMGIFTRECAPSMCAVSNSGAHSTNTPYMCSLKSL